MLSNLKPNPDLNPDLTTFLKLSNLKPNPDLNPDLTTFLKLSNLKPFQISS